RPLPPEFRVVLPGPGAFFEPLRERSQFRLLVARKWGLLSRNVRDDRSVSPSSLRPGGLLNRLPFGRTAGGEGRSLARWLSVTAAPEQRDHQEPCKQPQ